MKEVVVKVIWLVFFKMVILVIFGSVGIIVVVVWLDGFCVFCGVL